MPRHILAMDIIDDMLDTLNLIKLNTYLKIEK